MAVVAMKQLLEAGVHFGHQTKRWDPRMAEYIFQARNGIHIIDLQKTSKKLDEAYSFMKEQAEEGKTVLFVGTKKQSQDCMKEAAEKLAAAGFDMEIVEKHHKLKVDAPSGTALALADSINEGLDNAYHYVYDRSQVRQKRDEKEIGISAVRGGTIVGEHEVIFAGADEVVTFQHTAYSKAIFGKGAIQAAKFIKGKGPGWYQMSDVIG